MSTLSYPGVYIQEIPSGVRPIRAVATSIAAFIDFFSEGPMNEAVRIQGLSDFVRRFGGYDTRSAASYGIGQFFLNGGSEAHVVRVASGTPRAAAIQIEAADGSGTMVMTVRAANEGVWGNHLRLQIDLNTDDDGDVTSFNLSVLRYDPEDPFAVVGAEGPYLNLSVDPSDPRYFPTIVNEESGLIEVVHGDGTNAAPGVDVFPAASGTLGTAIDEDLTTLVDGDFLLAVLDAGGDNISGRHRVNFVAPTGTVTLALVRRALESAIRQATPVKDGGTPMTDPPPTSALLTGASVQLVGQRLQIRIGRRSGDYDPDLRAVTTAGAKDPGLGVVGGVENVQQYSLGAGTAVGQQIGPVLGADGDLPDATALRGDPDDQTGLYALENVDLFNILCLPRAAELEDLELRAVVEEAITYCESRRSMFIIDVPANVDEIEDVENWIDDHANFRHRNTVLYFPRLLVPDPENDFRERSVGASGTMAGIFSRTDSSRGVWKAPAGVEATLRGLSRLDLVMTDAQNGTLNPLAVNCMRTFPIYGSVAWGARTLDGSDDAASEWKYIPIRRLALMIEESLFRGTKWVVFEPNDEPLWAKIRQNVGAFMMRLFRQGAFQGDTPSKAFFVKCDGETTTAADRNLGVVNIEVGFAPLKPAEFVVIKIQQIPDVD